MKYDVIVKRTEIYIVKNVEAETISDTEQIVDRLMEDDKDKYHNDSVETLEYCSK